MKQLRTFQQKVIYPTHGIIWTAICKRGVDHEIDGKKIYKFFLNDSEVHIFKFRGVNILSRKINMPKYAN